MLTREQIYLCMWYVCECLLPYWFVHWTNTVDSFILLDNFISPLLFRTPISSLGSPSLYSARLHLSHLLSTLWLSRTKQGTAAVSVREGMSPWGDDRGTKTWARWRERERERMRGSIEGRLGGKERKEGKHRSWHRDILWLIKGQHCISAESH